MNNFISELIQFLVLIPAAVFCYLPMRNQIRISRKRLIIHISLLLGIVIPSLALLSVLTKLSSNLLFLPFVIIIFGFYSKSLKVELSKSLCVFVFVLTLMSIPTNISLAYDAWIHPTDTIKDFCLQASLCQFAVSMLFMLVLSPFLYRYGSKLIDSLQPKVCYMLLPISICFLTLNLFIEPRVYSTLHTGKVFQVFVIYISVTFSMYLFLHVIFYFISMELLGNLQNAKLLHFYEMQEHQYLSQQRYLEETTRLRHDFRQSIYTLQELAIQKDYLHLEDYLNHFCQQLPQNEICSYCTQIPVNALLNYYKQIFSDNHIRTAWNISLKFPENTTLILTDLDFCGLLGNLLENGFYGCLTLPENQRYHKLSITIQHKQNLYISSINSFDGIVQKEDTIYHSTRKKGSGIGLSSIKVTANKYHGSAQFSHLDKEFFMDVVLIISTPTH